jgi:hypothetical protein
MKGIVFTEFIEMLENKFSPELADRVISESELESGGAYTAVGTYDHNELLRMVGVLSEITEKPANELVYTFGRHLFGRFTEHYPDFFAGINNSFDFLDTIEKHVHVEVRKLYPDAELPRFATERPDGHTMIMTYDSKRPFGDLALGLIEGSVEYYGEDVKVESDDLSEDKTQVRFTLKQAV